jgi:hypothetical protein
MSPTVRTANIILVTGIDNGSCSPEPLKYLIAIYREPSRRSRVNGAGLTVVVASKLLPSSLYVPVLPNQRCSGTVMPEETMLRLLDQTQPNRVGHHAKLAETTVRGRLGVAFSLASAFSHPMRGL